MNNVALIGRLTKDPDLRYTQSQKAVVRFIIAVNRRLSKQRRQELEASNMQTADFISCVAWDKTAQLIADYFVKGSQIAIDGRIQTGSYEKEGRRIYTTDVVVENLHFIGNSNKNQRRDSGFNQDYSNGFDDNSMDQSKSRSLGGEDLPINSAYDDDNDNAGFFPVDNDDIPF